MAAAGAGYGVRLFRDRRLPFQGASRRIVAVSLACGADVWLSNTPLRWSVMGRTLGAAALACAGLWLA